MLHYLNFLYHHDYMSSTTCSCHYHLDPMEAQRFWLFEGSALSLGVLAYAVVVYRIRKMERLTALRIQQQINA